MDIMFWWQLINIIKMVILLGLLSSSHLFLQDLVYIFFRFRFDRYSTFLQQFRMLAPKLLPLYPKNFQIFRLLNVFIIYLILLNYLINMFIFNLRIELLLKFPHLFIQLLSNIYQDTYNLWLFSLVLSNSWDDWFEVLHLLDLYVGIEE